MKRYILVLIAALFVLVARSSGGVGGVNPFPLRSINGDRTPAQVFITAAAATASITSNGSGVTTFYFPNSSSSTGTVSSVSVTSANGLAGTVATATTTPAITLSTSITGLLKGNGTAISAQTTGNLTAGTSDGISVGGGSGSVLGSGTTITQQAASASANGYLTSANWSTFNSKISSPVNLATQVTGNLGVSNLNSGTNASSSTFWRGDGTWTAPAATGAVWGSITGTLSSQTDLNSALAAKGDVSSNSSSSDAGYFSYYVNSGGKLLGTQSIVQYDDSNKSLNVNEDGTSNLVRLFVNSSSIARLQLAAAVNRLWIQTVSSTGGTRLDLAGPSSAHYWSFQLLGSASGENGSFQINHNDGNPVIKSDTAGNVSVGFSAPATTATNGFLNIPRMTGTPTGVPSLLTGFSPVVHDDTNNKICVYSTTGSAWKCATLL